MRYVFFQLFLACKNNLENQKWRFSSADLSTWVVLSIFMTVVRACCTSEFSFVFFLLNLTSWFTSNARMLSHVLACESSIFFFSPTSFLSKRETKWGNSDFFLFYLKKWKTKNVACSTAIQHVLPSTTSTSSAAFPTSNSKSVCTAADLCTAEKLNNLTQNKRF